MALYWTDFSDYTSDQQPSNWTQRYVQSNEFLVRDDVEAEGGKYLQLQSGGAFDMKGLSWDVIDADPNRDDVEILMLFKSEANGQLSTLARGSGGIGTETYYGMRTRFFTTGDSVLGLSRINGSNSSISGSPFNINISLTDGERFWKRVRFNGSDIKYKIWKLGDPEPSTWLAELTNTDISQTGWVGIQRQATTEEYIDIFSVATNGETASLENPNAGEPTSYSASTRRKVVNDPPKIYWTDFSEYTVNQKPSDWSYIDVIDTDFRVRSNPNAIGGQLLEVIGSSTFGSELGLIWDQIENDPRRDDVEILTRTLFFDEDTRVDLVSRYLSQGDGYIGRIESDIFFEEASYRGIRLNNGSLIATGSSNFISYVPIQPVNAIWTRYRVNGNTLQMKSWKDGSSEPSGWDTTDDIDAYLGVGSVGIRISGTVTGYIDIFSVATGGATAPTENIIVSYSSSTNRQITELSTYNGSTERNTTQLDTYNGTTSRLIKTITEYNGSTDRQLNQLVSYDASTIRFITGITRSFVDNFDRELLGNDYSTVDITGVGNTEIVNDRVVITANVFDGVTARHALKVDSTFENPIIYLRDVQFSDVSQSFQPTWYFVTEGNFHPSNHQNGYFLWFFGNEFYLGKITNGGVATQDVVNFTRTVNTNYDIKFQANNGVIQATMWESGTEEPAPQLNWTDTNNPYTEGGITLPSIASSPLSTANVSFDRIEVNYAFYNGSTNRSIQSLLDYNGSTNRSIITPTDYSGTTERKIVEVTEYSSETMRNVTKSYIYISKTQRNVLSKSIYEAQTLRELSTEADYTVVYTDKYRTYVLTQDVPREIDIPIRNREYKIDDCNREINIELETRTVNIKRK